MTEYVITLRSCDGSTSLLVELADVEAKAVRRIAALSEAKSDYANDPTLYIAERSEADPYYLERALGSDEYDW